MEPCIHQAQNFIATGFRLNKVWLRLIKRQKAVSKRGQPKEVIFFLNGPQGALGVVGALPLNNVSLGFELFAAVTILGGIGFLVNVAVLVDFLDKRLTADFMPFFGGLDEIVIGDFQSVPDCTELAGHVVYVGLGFQAQFLSALRDLDGVLIVAHQEMDLLSLHALVSRLDIGPYFLEGRTNMGAAVRIIDGGCNVETRSIAHGELSQGC